MATAKPSIVIIGAREENDRIFDQVGDLVNVLASEPEAGRAIETIEEHDPDLAVLVLDHDVEGILAATENVGKTKRCLPVVVSCRRDPDSILSAMRAGARDFAFLDQESNDVRRAVSDLLRSVQASGGDKLGTVLAVLSAKGGSGATTVASNLAGILAGRGSVHGNNRVVLIDFDLELGDVVTFMDVSAPFSYRELLDNMHRLDADLVYRSLKQHDSGVYVMSQSDYVEEGRELSGDDAAAVIDLLRQYFDFVIVDGLRDFREIALVALDKADHILVTLTQDIPALRNTHRCLNLFKRLGYGGERIKLVVNRYHKRGEISLDAISDALQHPVAITLDSNFATVVKAVNQGKLLVETSPSSQVAKDLARLADQFHARSVPKKQKVFSLWGKRWH